MVMGLFPTISTGGWPGAFYIDVDLRQCPMVLRPHKPCLRRVHDDVETSITPGAGR